MPDADCIGNTITTAATATTHCLRTAIFVTISPGFRKKTHQKMVCGQLFPYFPAACFSPV